MSNIKQDKSKNHQLENLKSFIELLAALVAITPLLFSIWAFIQQGLQASLPAWLAVTGFVVAIVASYILGYRRGRVSSTNLEVQNTHPASPIGRTLLQLIDFKYDDSPINHAWEIIDVTNSDKVIFQRVSDGFFGNAIQIESVEDYGLDLKIHHAMQIGKYLEFALHVTPGYGLYTRVDVENKDKTKHKLIWLNFQTGSFDPILFDKENEEWFVYMSPDEIGGEWVLYKINLDDAVAKTVGKDGWQFRKIKSIRIRGNISVAYIAHYSR